MIIVKELGLSLIISTGAVAAADLALRVFEWIGQLFQ
jgi:hypothetical protein